MKLYELTQEYELLEEALERWAEEHEGDISDFPLNERFEDIEKQRDKKLLNIGAMIVNANSDIAALKAQAAILNARAARKQLFSDRMLSYAKSQLKEGETLEDDRVKYKWHKSSSVVVEDVNKLMKKFLKPPVKVPDKTAIKAAIKSGAKVRSARIEEKNNLSVK